jgi:hypothetical protein
MVKVSQVNSAHCKNWTCILKRREYELISWMENFGVTKSLRYILEELKSNVSISRRIIYLFNPYIFDRKL